MRFLGSHSMQDAFIGVSPPCKMALSGSPLSATCIHRGFVSVTRSGSKQMRWKKAAAGPPSESRTQTSLCPSTRTRRRCWRWGTRYGPIRKAPETFGGGCRGPGRPQGEGEALSPSSPRISPADPGAKPPGREVGWAPVAAAGQHDRRDQPQPRRSPAPRPLPGAPSPSPAPCHRTTRGVTPLRGGGSVHREPLGWHRGQRGVPGGGTPGAGAPEPLQPAHRPGAGGVQAGGGAEKAGAAG